MGAPSRYCAFISYSHEDARWAIWLQRRLEAYRLPKRLRGVAAATGVSADRLGPCFRDRSDLAVAVSLSGRIEEALAQSSALILVCSPQAAASTWVNQEVVAFRKLRSAGRIFCLIVSGEPGTGNDCECFPPALSAIADSDGSSPDPIAADVRPGKDGKTLALQKLIAGLLGVNLDELRRREAQRRSRKLLVIAMASMAGMALTLGLSIFALMARNDAQRRQAQAEDLVGFLHGDLRQKLEKVGRLDLLDTVGDKSMAYFAALDPRDLTDTMLLQQTKALSQVGQVRFEQGHHDKALAAFNEAHARAKELSARYPRDAQRRFLLAETEGHLGELAWAQGRYDVAGTWLRAYRDSALALAALEPHNFAWQREVAYGHHNLAVLDQSLGKYAEAEKAFRTELALYRDWIREHPNDAKLRHDAANVASYLGSLTARPGRLHEAVQFFDEDVRAIRANLEAEPSNSSFQAELAEELVLLAETQVWLGDVATARENLRQSRETFERLTQQDPANAEWRNGVGYTRWWQAMIGAPEDAETAMADAIAAEALFSSLYAAAPEDQVNLLWLAKARLQLARFALRRKQFAAANDWFVRAQALLTPSSSPQPNEIQRDMLVEAHLLEGDLHQQEGDIAGARRSWTKAEQLLLADIDDPTPFGRLDMLVRVQRSLGKQDLAATHLERLNTAGYVPLVPWPRVAAANAEVATLEDR